MLLGQNKINAASSVEVAKKAFIKLSVEYAVMVSMKVPMAKALHLEVDDVEEEELIEHTKNLKTENLTLQN